jgi:hypothetical protein
MKERIHAVFHEEIGKLHHIIRLLKVIVEIKKSREGNTSLEKARRGGKERCLGVTAAESLKEAGRKV